ncbi:MAG: hypothetical protein WC670_18415 [Pseudolabrys sp.]|jgi:hypothetical protein
MFIKKFWTSLSAALALASVAALLLGSPVRAADLSLNGNLRGLCGTVTATGNGTAGAATLANKCGVVTTDTLTTPTSSNYALTLTNTVAAAADLVVWSIDNGSNTTGIPVQATAVVSAGAIVFNVRQSTGTNFNGTLKIKYFVIKP